MVKQELRPAPAEGFYHRVNLTLMEMGFVDRVQGHGVREQEPGRMARDRSGLFQDVDLRLFRDPGQRTGHRHAVRRFTLDPRIPRLRTDGGHAGPHEPENVSAWTSTRKYSR